MQFKNGQAVKTADGRAGVIRSAQAHLSKIELSDGTMELAMNTDLTPIGYSKSGERLRDPKPAVNVFGGATTRATEAENFFKFPLDQRIIVEPTEDTGAEVDPRTIGKRGNVVVHHKGRIGVRLEGRTQDDFFKPEHLQPIQTGR
jgi:hypothetical protein